VGDRCNYEMVDNGRIVIAFPYGTIVTDDNMRPLVCGPDNTFKYVDAP
jgi:hypothetical protein